MGGSTKLIDNLVSIACCDMPIIPTSIIVFDVVFMTKANWNKGRKKEKKDFVNHDFLWLRAWSVHPFEVRGINR